MNKKLKKLIIKFIIILIILICANPITVFGAGTKVSDCAYGVEGDAGWDFNNTPGDQGGEYTVKEWYPFYAYVLRYPDRNKANTIANIAVSAANNDAIGYCQPHRLTYYEQLSKCNYNPTAIKTNCEADCSSSTSAAVKTAGILTNDSNLSAISEGEWTGSIIDAYTSHGFQLLSGAQYTSTPDNLIPGDVLLQPGSHVNIFVGDAQGGNFGGGFSPQEIDDIIVNLDEQNFDFSGTAKNITYSGSKKAGEWIFEKISQFIDFIVAIIANGIKMSVLGWMIAIEGTIDGSIKYLEGYD